MYVILKFDFVGLNSNPSSSHGVSNCAVPGLPMDNDVESSANTCFRDDDDDDDDDDDETLERNVLLVVDCGTNALAVDRIDAMDSSDSDSLIFIVNLMMIKYVG